MFMPEHWTARMTTISEYREDASAMGRINAWWMAWNLAAKNFFGGGYEIYNLITFSQYAPDPTDVHAATQHLLPGIGRTRLHRSVPVYPPMVAGLAFCLRIAQAWQG